MAKKSKMDPRAQAAYDEIYSAFPERNDCVRELLKYATLICDHCGFAGLEVGDERKTKCPRCRKICWVTASSWFRYVKKPRLYLVTMTLLARGIKINASQLAKLTNVAPNTATTVLKKFGVVISRYLEGAKHKRINAAAFKAVLSKRTRLSVAGEHPTYEFYKRALILNLAKGLRSRSVKTLEPLPRRIYDMVGRKPRSIDSVVNESGMDTGDAVASLTDLALRKLVRFENGTDVVKENPVATWLASHFVKPKQFKQVFQNFEAVQTIFYGVGRKYIQLYLALIWCWVDDVTWTQEFLHKAVSKHPYVRSIDLRAYDSPDKVLVPAESKKPARLSLTLIDSGSGMSRSARFAGQPVERLFD